MIYAKIIEIELQGCRKKTTTSRAKKRDIDLKLNEEKWMKGSKKKKTGLYHTTPNKRQVEKVFPSVMKWGGKHNGVHLENTCTIDNALTILHLKYIENVNFESNVSVINDDLFNTLLTIFSLMSDKKYEEAKLIWTNHMDIKIEKSTNLFCDEVDFFVKCLDGEWKSYTTSICDNTSCAHPLIESRITNGITIG